MNEKCVRNELESLRIYVYLSFDRLFGSSERHEASPFDARMTSILFNWLPIFHIHSVVVHRPTDTAIERIKCESFFSSSFSSLFDMLVRLFLRLKLYC